MSSVLFRVPTVGQFCFTVSTNNGIGPTANCRAILFQQLMWIGLTANLVSLTKRKLCRSGNVRQIEFTIKFIIAILYVYSFSLNRLKDGNFKGSYRHHYCCDIKFRNSQRPVKFNTKHITSPCHLCDPWEDHQRHTRGRNKLSVRLYFCRWSHSLNKNHLRKLPHLHRPPETAQRWTTIIVPIYDVTGGHNLCSPN